MSEGRIVMQDPQVGDGIEVRDRKDKKVVIGDGLKEGIVGAQIYGGRIYSSAYISDAPITDAPIAPPSQLLALEQFFANLITGEVGRQIGECMALTKEQLSDVIGTQLDALKAGEVADAVKAAVEIAVSQAVADGKRAANMDSFKEVQKRYNVGLKYGDINELIDLIDETREKILSRRQTLRTVRQALADADLDLKEAEAGLLSDIMAEVNDSTGKPLFSNDKARQAELMVRKKEDANYYVIAQQYKVVRDQAEALEDEVSSLDSDLKSAEMQFHAECKSLEAMTAEMNIYAAALGAGASATIGSVSGSYPGTLTKSDPVNKNSEPKGW